MSHADKYAVFGNPIKQSKSPVIHAAFATQCGQDIQYRAVRVELGQFAAAARRFFDGGGRGLNVTVPFKQDAFEFADVLSRRAQRAGAVNTLSREDDGSIHGDNTDGVGLVRDLTANLAVELSGKRLLLLGAGGAARGVLGPLLEQQPTHLVIANRTAERAEQLSDLFSDIGALTGCGFAALGGEAFDVVINATAAGLRGEVPDLPEGIIGPQTCCYDMMYGSAPTAFMRYAQQRGARRAFDGLGMLVEQAAESFRLWRGVKPATGPVIDFLRRH